jgi:hypothetical protein
MSPQPSPWAPLGSFVVPNGQVGTTGDTLSAPVSGRVTGLWADPSAPDQNLYIATAAGGAWHTADGGVTWAPLLDSEATLATGAITSANGIVYVGTGEANYGGDNVTGLGVVTIDIAANTKTYDYLPQFAGQVISRLAVDDPANPALLYVASSNGLWRKELSTGTWKELPVTGLATSQDITDVLVNPAGRLYAGVNGRGVFTSDTHDTLVRVVETVANLPTTLVGRVALTMCRNAAQTIYAAIADPSPANRVQIFRCDDAPQAVGDSPAASLWTAVAVPPPSGTEVQWYTNVIGVHPRDPDVVYYGETHLWRSKNGGRSWERSTSQHGKAPGAHADQHALVIQDEPLTTPKSFDGVKLWAGNDGGVWRSVDGGGTWKPRNRGLSTMQYFAVATHPTERNIVAAGAQDNGTQRYLGDGAWELADYGDGCYVAFDPVDPTIWYNGYVSYGQSGTGTRRFSGFKVSTRSGQLGSYTAAAGRPGSATAIGATDEALFYAPFLVVPPSGGATAADIWVGTDRLYYSNSRGDRWYAVTASLLTPPLNPNTRGRGVSAIAVPSGVSGRVYAGTSEGRFYRIDQVGVAWSLTSATTTEMVQATPPPHVPVLLAAGMAAGSFLSAIAAARLPSGEDRVVVGVGRNHIDPPPPLGPLTPFPAGSHLFVSSDSGASFTEVALPDIAVPGLAPPGVPGAQNSVNGLVIDPANPDIVFIACDTGVFRYDASTPAVTPEPWTTGLPNTVAMGIELVPSAPRLLRVATHGRGVWETAVEPADAPASPIQLVLRDTLHDDGRSASPASSPDPFDKNKTLDPMTSLDIALDVPGSFSGDYTVTSTVDYTTTGTLDYIGFHDLAGGSSPVRGVTVKVYVRAHNRGSTPATAVKVALAWADNANPLPALPAGFFAAFPVGQPAGGTSWPAVGTPVTIDHIGPGEAGVAAFDWPITSDMPSKARLLAVVSSAEDPFVDPAETSSAAAALKSRFVAVRDVEISVDTSAWIIVLAAIGVVAAGAVILKETQ